jgi:Nucleotidyl transferase AbiEii toxin, Type IV TA system
MTDAIETVAALIAHAGVSYVLIGGHAVNAWIEPRFTADIDLTVSAGPDGLARLGGALASMGLTVSQTHCAELPSGPDFVRFTTADGGTVLEVQVAKTEFQREVIRRAAEERAMRVATPEDLIVMKLIADRPKDQIDVHGLAALPDLDWAYIEHWAAEWGVTDRLRRLHAADE